MKKGLFLQLIPCLLVLILSSAHFSIAGTNPSSYKGEGDSFLSRIGVYISGAGFDEGGVEIATYDPSSQQVFSTNGDTGNIDILNIQDPGSPEKVAEINPSDNQAGAKAANSVAFKNGVLVAAVEHEEDGQNGFAMFYNAQGKFLASTEIGVLPDMVTITKDGSKAVTALEGEPYVDDNNTIHDPVGGVTILDMETHKARIVTFNGVYVYRFFSGH